MMYEIIISERAFKEIDKLEKTMQERIINALERIRFRPYAFITKLVGDTGYRLRAGDYRIIIDIDKNRLVVLKVGHRKNIYKNL